VQLYLAGGALRLLKGGQQTLVALTPLLEDLLELLHHPCKAVVQHVVYQVHEVCSQRRRSQCDCYDVPRPTSYGSGALCATLASAAGAKLTAMAAAAAASRPRRLATVTLASGSAAAHTVTDLRSGATKCRLEIKVAALEQHQKCIHRFHRPNSGRCRITQLSAMLCDAT
jgi:hypothetical protein